MAALTQTYPQQSGTVTLLQTKPGSATGIMPGTSQAHSGQMYGNPQRNAYGSGSQSGYRAGAAAPIQPYAFTSTPSLANNGQLSQQGAGYRTSSGTTVPTLPQLADSRGQPSMTTARPPLNATSTQPTFAQVVAAKASPERYRRPAPRQSESSASVAQTQQVQGAPTPAGSNMPATAQLYNPRSVPRNQAITPARPQSAHGALTGATMDDMHLYRHPAEEEAKRYRRRSIHSINSADYIPTPSTQGFKRTMDPSQSDALAASRKQVGTEKEQRPTRVVPLPPPAGGPSHVRNGSSESVVSSRSSNSRPSSSTNRNANASAPTGSPASTSSLSGDKVTAHDQPKHITIPPRGSSSTDVGKRVLNPSPLSNPATMPSGSSSNEVAAAAAASPAKSPPPSQAPKTDSPAAKQLAALNEKGAKSKSKTSRLRRAFSFGSAAELRKVTGQDITAESIAMKSDDPSRLPKTRAEQLYEEEQARVAQRQEEGGIGSSIYSGTRLFAGSTDNLSISSTASSASIMLRKMGRGVKKGSRSLVGLFRPKSMIGSPNEELGAPEASQATVSMVTVEAERDRVNVNTNADLANATGTGFPHLERNSMDATKSTDGMNSDRPGTSNENSAARKSILGGDKERAEVLATIRKGILKTRSNSPTPPARTAEGKNFDLPMIPNVADSPNSSAPSTPNDDVHKRNGSVTIGSEDYFMSALRLRQDTKSAPGTPQASQKRNATFSPRIVFYDTWPSGEYDRRGEIATCNRLTPMLAQQIKEELNTFKMEMEVHETSKIYTHFF